MYRFLIVEDMADARDQVAEYLGDLFPGATVEAAETVREGAALIERAQCPFDCVILDYMLPKDKGCSHEGDVSLCNQVREAMPSTIVAHVSAYLGHDNALQEHLDRCHNELADPRAIILAKDENWVRRLGITLKRHFVGKEIEYQLDDLFGREREQTLVGEGHVERANGARPLGDTTYLLARVSQDITGNWDILDHALKQRIRRLFKVVEEPGEPVRIGLL